MGKYFKKIFWLVISIAMIFQSSHLSFAEEIINQNNSSLLMEETIKEDVENIQTDGEISVAEKNDKNAIKNSPQENNELTNISTASTSRGVRKAKLNPTDVFQSIDEAKGKVPNPGDVHVYPAKVTEDPTYANTWEVMMRVVAHDSVKKSKVVLVIDTSGSMNDNNRMIKTKEAAKVFVNTLYPSESEKKADIAIIGYETNVSEKAGFNSSKQDLMNAINGLSANGGTFTQGGVHKARELLEGGGNENKYIVLLSDGEPTFCNGIKDINGLSIEKKHGKKVITDNIVENNYIYNKQIGNGNNRYAYTGFYNIFNKIHMDCGIAAIDEAGFAKRDGVTMYTVGLQLEEEGKSILEKMATTGKFIGVEDPDYLKNEFSKIASQIYNATNNASVNVNFQKGIELKTGVSVNDIDHEGGAVSIKDGKPVWELGTVDTPLEDGSEYKYAYIRFKVSVNDEILSTDNPKKTKLLGNINFTYKDKDGIEKKIPIKEDSEQEVKLYVLRKIIKDSTSIDNEHRIFKFKVIGDDYNKEYELKSSVIGTYKNCKILKDVKKNTRYQVYESEGALAYDETDNNHKLFNVKDYYNNSEIYMSNDLTQKGSKVEGALASGGVTPVANIHIDGQSDKFLTVENSEKKLLAKMTVNKIIKVKRSVSPTRSAKNTNLPKETSFSFSIKDGQTIIKNGEVKIGSDLKGSKTFEGLSFKEYTLHENEESIQPNTPFKPEQNDIKFKIYLYDVLNNKDKGKEINFVNEFDSEHNSASVDFTAHKIWVNGNKSDFDKVSFKLFRTVGGGTKEEVKNVTPTKVKKDDYKFDYKWSKLPKYNKDVKEYTYSVEEEGVSNGNVTINGNTYAVNQNGNTITNTYKIPKIDKFEAKKEWSVDPSMANKVTYPTMQFNLYRKTASVAEEKVVNAEPKEINKANTTATWTNLDKTNKDGEVYTYYVKENFKENKIENDNWVLGQYNPSERKITNKLEDDKTKKGKLTIEKKFTNIPKYLENKVFDFEVQGPYGYRKTVQIKAGSKMEIDGLYYGNYTIKEVIPENALYKVFGSVEQNISLRKNEPVNVLFTNILKDVSTINISVNKEWKGNGPVSSVKINLLMNGKKTNKSLELNKNNNWKGEFVNLEKRDDKGELITYSIAEEKINNYETAYSNNLVKNQDGKITVTNTYKKENNPYIPGNGNNKIIVDRIGGETRIETAVELSKKVDKSDTVIIANAYKFPDAMASAPLAYLKNGVILLTTGDKSKGVPKATINEIQRLKAKNIIVVGGNSSVSDEEVSALKKVAKNIKRIGGVDRYQTSELIAYEVNKLTDNKNKVVVASGEVFPDALSVGSYASRKGLAIILSKHNQLPLYSKQAIKNIGANDFIIVGGVNTISKSVEESINGKKVRYAGLDRYETAKEIAENTYSNPNRVFIASGEIFIDSLVVGPVAGRFEAPILLTNKNSLPKPTKDFTMKSSVKHITIVGGVNTVSKKVENELNK